MREEPKSLTQADNIDFEQTPTQVKDSNYQDDEDVRFLDSSRNKRSLYSIKKILFAVLALTMIILIFYLILLASSPPPLRSDKSYVLPTSFYTTYPDLTHIKGKYKEAYAFLLCSSRVDNAGSIHFYFEALLAFILRLKKAKADETRDIIVLACDFTYDFQFDIIRKTGVILIPVEVVITERVPVISWWTYNFTKFYLWKLIFWDRILFLDIDLFCDDRLFNIWDDPATRLQTKPPEGVDLDSVWYGQTVRSLYPYIEAYTYDTWSPSSKGAESFNNGIFIFKPSLEHYNVLMNITYNYSIPLEVMEQTALNVAYSKKGPVPWTTFNETYNMATLVYKKADWIVCYHGKLWYGGLDDELHVMWQKSYNELTTNFYNISIVSERSECLFANTSLTISKLRLTNSFGILYYLITRDFTYYPTYEEIKDAYMKSASDYIPISEGNMMSSITIDNITANVNYRVFYYAETLSRFNPVTDIYYRNCSPS